MSFSLQLLIFSLQESWFLFEAFLEPLSCFETKRPTYFVGMFGLVVFGM
jgi:hypothetical protein